jgi:uncharacterized protein YpbB
MQEDFIHGLFILAAHRLSGQRTPRALVHLMKGRKNNQVIADASLFQLSLLYGFLSDKENQEIENLVGQAFDHGWITQRQAGSKLMLLCTDAGEAQLDNWDKLYGYSSCMEAVFNIQMREVSLRFWKRLELLVQTLSNLIQQEHRFLPVIEERGIQNDIKGLVKQYGMEDLARQLKADISKWLENLSDWEQKAILLRLSGKQKAGLTFNQIGQQLNKPDGFVFMHLLRLGAEQVSAMEKFEGERFSVFKLLVDSKEEAALSESAKLTKKMIDEGLSLAEIEKRRSLKRGTIEDHLVEIALGDPLFDITQFVEGDKIAFIHTIMNEHETRRLGEIKKIAGESYTYLDIRLACTRSGREVK